METNVLENMVWDILLPTPLHKFNITIGSNVNKLFLNKIIFLGFSNYEKIISILFNEEELDSLTWHWKKTKINYPSKVFLFKVDIENYRGKIESSFEYDRWIFGIFECSDNIFRLCPIKKESEYDIDIFEKIISSTSHDFIEYPWENNYHNRMVQYYTNILENANVDEIIHKKFF